MSWLKKIGGRIGESSDRVIREAFALPPESEAEKKKRQEVNDAWERGAVSLDDANRKLRDK